jgi:hypothetical protein
MPKAPLSVATEIRRLADQTAVATFDIEQMVKKMQSAVAAGVMGMDKFGEQCAAVCRKCNRSAPSSRRLSTRCRRSLRASPGDPETKSLAFSLGANDYLVKLPDQLELVARVRYHSNACLSRIRP